MNKKKIIIICAFLLLIFATAIFTAVAAIKSYQFDMDPANGVDIMEGFGAAYIGMIGEFAVFYELDLFYTVYYFFVMPKKLTKSILVIVSNITLLLMFFADNLIDLGKRYFPIVFNSALEESIVPIGLLLIYAVLKLISLMVDWTAKEA